MKLTLDILESQIKCKKKSLMEQIEKFWFYYYDFFLNFLTFWQLLMTVEYIYMVLLVISALPWTQNDYNFKFTNHVLDLLFESIVIYMGTSTTCIIQAWLMLLLYLALHIKLYQLFFEIAMNELYTF